MCYVMRMTAGTLLFYNNENEELLRPGDKRLEKTKIPIRFNQII